jgi:hypothetical protein
MKTFWIRILLVGILVAAKLSAEPALVGHPGLTGQALDADAVKAVLLGKKVTLGDTRVVLIIAKSADAQEQFLKASVGMSTSQFQNHWRRLFMTGGGTAPKIVETEDEACKLAADTPGGVAIIEKAKAGTLAVLAAAK